jgi:hypothetical protein
VSSDLTLSASRDIKFRSNEAGKSRAQSAFPAFADAAKKPARNLTLRAGFAGLIPVFEGYHQMWYHAFSAFC